MLIVIAIAAGAALTVIAYNKVREKDPELASASMRRVHQLAAVIVVLTTGIEKTFDALASGSRPKPVYASSYGSRPSWRDVDEHDWDES